MFPAHLFLVLIQLKNNKHFDKEKITMEEIVYKFLIKPYTPNKIFNLFSSVLLVMLGT